MLVESQEIGEVVFVAKGIIDSGEPILRVVNTTAEFQCIRNDKVIMEKLRNFHIYFINPCSLTSRHRIDTLVLRDQMPEDIRPDLMPFCESYSDIFALDDDK